MIFLPRRKNLSQVSQQEIVSLYERFCQLDRSAKGFVSEDEFLSIPEFSTNPLSQVRQFASPATSLPLFPSLLAGGALFSSEEIYFCRSSVCCRPLCTN
jgi:hypothetical protein